MSVELIVEESLKLKPSDRVRVVNTILQSIEIGSPEIDQLWGEESAKRFNAYMSNKSQGISRQELMKDYL